MKNKKKRSAIFIPVFRLKVLLCLLGILFAIILITLIASLFQKDPFAGIARTDIQISEKLSSEQIKTFCETSDGYLWIGTESGLNRFDGTNYLQFYANNDTTSLINNNINRLEESRYYPRRLLVSAYNGSCIYLPNGTFVPIQDKLSYVKEISRDTLSVRSLEQVSFYNIDQNTNQVKKIQDISFSSSLIEVIPNFDGTFWVFTAKEAYLYNIKLDRISQKPFSQVLSQVFIPEEGKAWLLFDNSFVEMDLKTSKFIESGKVRFVNEQLAQYPVSRKRYSNGLLSLVVYKKPEIVLIDVEKQTVQEQLFEKMNNSEIGAVFRDHTGNVWVGSRGFGVQTKYLKHELFSDNNQLSTFFNNKDITVLRQSKSGSLWVVTSRNNLFCYDKTGIIHTIDCSSIPNSYIYHLEELSNGHLMLVLTGKVVDCLVQNDKIVVLKEYKLPLIYCRI